MTMETISFNHNHNHNNTSIAHALTPKRQHTTTVADSNVCFYDDNDESQTPLFLSSDSTPSNHMFTSINDANITEPTIRVSIRKRQPHIWKLLLHIRKATYL